MILIFVTIDTLKISDSIYQSNKQNGVQISQLFYCARVYICFVINVEIEQRISIGNQNPRASDPAPLNLFLFFLGRVERQLSSSHFNRQKREMAETAMNSNSAPEDSTFSNKNFSGFSLERTGYKRMKSSVATVFRPENDFCFDKDILSNM